MAISYYSVMAQSRKSLRQNVLALITHIAEDDTLPDIGAHLNAVGVTPTPPLEKAFETLTKKLGVDSDSRKQLSIIMATLIDAPSPTGTLVNFSRFVDSTGVSQAFLSTAASGKPIREILAAIFSSSQYMSDIIIRNPGYLYWLIERQNWEAPVNAPSLIDALKKDVDQFGSQQAKLDAVRRFQRRTLLKIGVKDLLGLQDIETTANNLSELARALVTVVLDIVWNEVAQTGQPQCPEGFAVLALGKLGGGELNYSSDIDLIYLCEDTDENTMAFYHKIATKFSNAVADVTSEGYLYRVDLRLRPDGKSGPLVNSITAMRVYYETRGRPWEFQAMLKASVLTGDDELGKRFLNFVGGLIFNPVLSYSPLEDIAQMRTRIRDNISPHEKTFNIKLMEGGIRDIEFIIQTIQLLYGKKFLDIRVPNTTACIRIAQKNKLIKKQEATTLIDAYLFFRLVEHRLQMMHQFKTHSIPVSKSEVELLANRVSNGPLSRYTVTDFVDTLAQHLNKVRILSDSFFAGEAITEPLQLLLSPDNEDEAKQTLEKYGLSDHRQALSILRSLVYGSFPDLIDQNTRFAFKKLLPLLLETCAKTGDPGATLINFAKLVARSNSQKSLYELLVDSRGARKLVLDLAGTSSLLTAKLCANFETLDTMLEDPHAFLMTPTIDQSAEQKLRSDDGNVVYKTLQRSLDQKILAAWALDREHSSFPDNMVAAITVAIKTLVTHLFEAFIENREGVGLFAFGSFGIGEPRIASDLDLLIVTKDRDIEDVTRCVHAMSHVLFESRIVKIDFRLRGEGQNAPLVQDIATYKKYFSQRMSPWERIAYSKCSFWAGDEALASEFLQTVSDRVFGPITEHDRQELSDTRLQLEKLASQPHDLLETKRSKGGRYDIDYLCWMAAAAGSEQHALDASSSDRIAHAVKSKLVSNEEAAQLKRALKLFEWAAFILDLGERSLPSSADKLNETLAYIDKTATLLGIDALLGFEKELQLSKLAVRNCYERVAAASLGEDGL